VVEMRSKIGESQVNVGFGYTYFGVFMKMLRMFIRGAKNAL